MSPEPTLQSAKLERAIALEREAHVYRSQGKTEEAFNAFDEAASLYRETGEHIKAYLCFASAATCWHIRTGLTPLSNAATRNDFSAQEAMKAGHYEYAKARFLDAALLYEKEGDFRRYSICFYDSYQANAKIEWELFTRGRKDAQDFLTKAGLAERLLSLGRWTVNRLNHAVWGYGERPFRTFWVAAGIIGTGAVIYSGSGQILTPDGPQPISFWEGLYLSMITYTTVGFGDYLPLGWTRIFAVLEALSGIFLAPLFLIGLTRRYLRMYR